MAPTDTIKLSEAGALLGVGYRRTRQLLAAGELAGQRDEKTGRLSVTVESTLKLKRQRESGKKRSWRNRAR